MANPKVYLNRLEKLAAFLDALPRKKFNFGELVINFDAEKKCGTAACAMGWTPVIFPKIVKYSYYGGINSRNCEYSTLSYAANELFGINEDEYHSLFEPASSFCPLNSDATPKQVAKHIRKFAAKKQKELKESQD